MSVHGANRLGGNSLADTVIFGRLVAEDINARKGDSRIPAQRGRARTATRSGRPRSWTTSSPASAAVPHHRIRDELRQVCAEQDGHFPAGRATWPRRWPDSPSLREQYREVCCRTPPGPFNFEILHVLELEGLLWLGEIIARGALARQESRGSHFRTDYPARDDAGWLRHTLARLDGDEIALSYPEVDISLYEPKERTY